MKFLLTLQRGSGLVLSTNGNKMIMHPKVCSSIFSANVAEVCFQDGYSSFNLSPLVEVLTSNHCLLPYYISL